MKRVCRVSKSKGTPSIFLSRLCLKPALMRTRAMLDSVNLSKWRITKHLCSSSKSQDKSSKVQALLFCCHLFGRGIPFSLDNILHHGVLIWLEDLHTGMLQVITVICIFLFLLIQSWGGQKKTEMEMFNSVWSMNSSFPPYLPPSLHWVCAFPSHSIWLVMYA